MTIEWIDDKTVIERLRIKSSRLDPLATQLRTAKTLNSLSLHPTGLPPSATLYIRLLRDPELGLLSLQNYGTRSSSEWERAIVARIEQFAREAARPINGAVPANAQAVIFRDRSELLACLAADWCLGEVITHWWWRSLLGRNDVAHEVLKTWMGMPEHIPMALQWLEVKHLSVPFAGKLSDESIYEITRVLVQRFGLYQLLPLIDWNEAIHLTHVDKAEKIKKIEAQDDSRNNNLVHPPWRNWTRDRSIDQLSVERQLLLGIGLMLHSAPSIVRSMSFVQRVKVWQDFVDNPRSDAPTIGTRFSAQVIEQPRAFMVRTLSESLRTTESYQIDSQFTFEPVSEIVPLDVTDKFVSVEDDGLPFHTEVETRKIYVETTELEIESSFGGVCYFVNLGLYLNLYGDFTTPLQPGIDLPIWDFVALVAQQVIGDEVTHDPIWSMLAQLAGRPEDEPPGKYFDPPEHETLGAWLDELMVKVRPRLQLALGVNNEDLLCFFKLPARILVTSTQLDVYFALADLPIEIRLSGLDRDPGWVPAAGRFIRFHYA